MHTRDLALLKQLKAFFGVGNIYTNKDGTSVYTVQSLSDLSNVIIPHFLAYPLITQKHADFYLFKSIIELINKDEHHTVEGLRKIVSIKAAINKGLSDNLNKAFPEITPAHRPTVEFAGIPDPFWVIGFVEGEACFYVQVSKAKSTKMGIRVNIRFIITQHSRDALLIKSLVSYLGCGHYREVINKSACEFVVSGFSDNNTIIIPFFKKYPLQGVKALDFADFCKVADIINVKGHLTTDGLVQICNIKAGMNRGRSPNSS
jgi:hypothetical protein